MKREIKFTIDSDIYEKFCLALNLTNDTEEEAVETCLCSYIAKTFEKASQTYNPKNISRQSEENAKDFYGKAINRIPMWALKPEQYNHKIIKAYFTALNNTGKATIAAMERLCGNKEHPDLYVPTFKNNYSQMKIDGPKSHGKVFEDDGDNVWIWPEVEEVLIKYKSSFWDDRMEK